MKLILFEDAVAFRDRTQSHLLHYPAEHNLLLGIQSALIRAPESFVSPPDLLVVESAGRLQAVGTRTPPYNFVLSKVEDFAALELMADYFHAASTALSGINSFASEAQAFAQTWQSLTGQSSLLKMHLRIHQLTQVRSQDRAQGYLRVATRRDRLQLLQWSKAFSQEALGDIEGDIERILDLQLKRQNLYVWCDGQIVSMVAGRLSQPGGGRIGPVYTPPEFRRRGYATACVAAISQMLLDKGAQRCCLFTDITNPTANHIYQTIGYEPVCDWHDYRFV
ncbi:GNAT family N-acetyltransferase [Acaryochloris sp. IP29b_bin.137]|uniref:GNAT family N-acetyltransferase n=1 Tax=Acaryochloris sp. IP29b_bin.137 TaxID=2969217 RepID=UPI002619D021|nr:GNAT family N-acetyltransferase [Acaryochloris sp. IP29b_bin.137]